MNGYFWSEKRFKALKRIKIRHWFLFILKEFPAATERWTAWGERGVGFPHNPWESYACVRYQVFVQRWYWFSSRVLVDEMLLHGHYGRKWTMHSAFHENLFRTLTVHIFNGTSNVKNLFIFWFPMLYNFKFNYFSVLLTNDLYAEKLFFSKIYFFWLY